MFTPETQIFIAAQDARQNVGAAPLEISSFLEASARQWAQELELEQRISHGGLDGSSPASRVAATGYSASVVLENAGLFIGGSDDSRHGRAAAAFVTMAYPDHLAQTIDPWVTQVGVAVVDGTYFGSPATWAVVDLARPTVEVPDSSAAGAAVLGGSLLLTRRRRR